MKFYEHPDYTQNKLKWEKYRDLFEGDHAVLTQYRYLWLHELELSSEQIIKDPASGSTESSGQRIRRLRANRSRYFNMTEPVISNLIAMAFRKPIIVDDETKKMLGDDIDNIDGKGTALESFIKSNIALSYFRDGNPIVQVDAPSNDSLSAGEEQMAGFRPFLETLDVLSVKDWQLFDSGVMNGKYESVRQEFLVVEPRTSLAEEPTIGTYCRVTSIDEGQVYVRVFQKKKDDDDWTLIKEIPLDLTEVPVVTITTNESWIKDVSELQLVLFNIMSAWYNQLNTQAFQRIFVAGLDESSAMSISEYAISRIPLEAKPFIIEPSSTAAYVEAAAITAEQIAQVAFNRARSIPSDSKEAPGANTLAEMNAELIALLTQALEEMEGLINSAIKVYAQFKLGPEKGSAFNGHIELPKELDIKAVGERIETFLTYRDEIRKVLPWRKAELRKVAAEMGYDDDTLTEITAGIEQLKDEPIINPLMGTGPFTAKSNGNQEGQANQKQIEPGSSTASNGAGSTGQ
ncbi:MAG: hypothetical protein E6R03_09250 [Hyphomicrobiaceae bacterium]|nr:MAG: hypothetical protein E6R03_09250 [Hyphomicrobiaceae bacterium]